MVFMLPRYYNQPYAASLHKSFNDNYDEVFRVDNYGFTEEELDFIINYDIKYRMGKDSEEAEE